MNIPILATLFCGVVLLLCVCVLFVLCGVRVCVLVCGVCGVAR